MQSLYVLLINLEKIFLNVSTIFRHSLFIEMGFSLQLIDKDTDFTSTKLTDNIFQILSPTLQRCWVIDFNGMSNRLGLFMPRGYGIAFIVRPYLHVCLFGVYGITTFEG